MKRYSPLTLILGVSTGFGLGRMPEEPTLYGVAALAIMALFLWYFFKETG